MGKFTIAETVSRSHIFFGAWFAFLVVMMTGRWLQVDTLVADALYRFQGNAWKLQDHALLEDIIHEGGRRMSQIMGAVLAAFLLASQIVPTLRPWRVPLVYLFMSVALATLMVSVIKQLVSMDCPWSLERYGGTREFFGLLQQRPPDYPNTACFPSGHASAGYSWLALYFFFVATRPRWRWAGLCFALILGLVFGCAQQLRGAHFLSHDLWTLMLCWSVSFTLAILLLSTDVAAVVENP